MILSAKGSILDYVLEFSSAIVKNIKGKQYII